MDSFFLEYCNFVPMVNWISKSVKYNSQLLYSSERIKFQGFYNMEFPLHIHHPLNVLKSVLHHFTHRMHFCLIIQDVCGERLFPEVHQMPEVDGQVTIFSQL